MPKLSNTLRAWRSDAFAETLGREIAALETDSLPLYKGVSQGGYIDASDIIVSVLRSDEDDMTLRVQVGVFFTEIVVCCGCGDDPMHQIAYCEMRIDIDKATADAEFTVIQD